MSNPMYVNHGHVSDRLTEELAELIQIICKTKRFGLFNVCPPGGGKPKEVGKQNWQLLSEEIADVEELLIEFKEWLQADERRGEP